MKNSKLTPSQVKLKNVLRPIVEGIMNEAEPTDFIDYQDLKMILNYANALSSVNLSHFIESKTIKDLEEQVRQIRIKIMQHVEQNSDFKFLGKSPSGFKLVKKK